jgi:hypothetical protein
MSAELVNIVLWFFKGFGQFMVYFITTYYVRHGPFTDTYLTHVILREYALLLFSCHQITRFFFHAVMIGGEDLVLNLRSFQH